MHPPGSVGGTRAVNGSTGGEAFRWRLLKFVGSHLSQQPIPPATSMLGDPVIVAFGFDASRLPPSCAVQPVKFSTELPTVSELGPVSSVIRQSRLSLVPATARARG